MKKHIEVTKDPNGVCLKFLGFWPQKYKGSSWFRSCFHLFSGDIRGFQGNHLVPIDGHRYGDAHLVSGQLCIDADLTVGTQMVAYPGLS